MTVEEGGGSPNRGGRRVGVVVVSVSGQSQKEKGERGEWCRLSCLSTKRREGRGGER